MWAHNAARMAASARSRRCCAAMRFSKSCSRLMCAPRCRKHFFSMLHPPPAKALLFASRRRQPISSSRSSGRFAPIFRTAASFTTFAGAVRNDLARPRHSAMLTNALLLFSPSPQWFTPTFPHRTYCRRKRFFPHRAAARPSAHRILQSSSRQHFASASSRSRNRA